MTKPTRIKAPQPTDLVALEGVWRSRGYGKLLDIRPDGYTLYEETRVSCLPVFEGSLEDLAEHYVEVHVSPRGHSFSARRAVGVTRVSFRRLRRLPDKCVRLGAEERHDPVYNFDVFWSTFAEHYALFELRGVDWNSTYERHRPAVEPAMPAEALFDTIATMLRPLRDGHVHLHSPHGHFNAGGVPPLYDRLAAELDVADDARDVPSYLTELREWLSETIHDEYLGSSARRSANRLLEWGRLNGNTGYLAIRAMAGLSGRVGRPREDVAAVDLALPSIIDNLGDLPTLVIDLRGNGGGYDSVALQLAGYFTDRRRLAFSKAARHRQGYTGRQPIYVEPRGRPPYLGQLIILTSGLTASAAEVFLLALLRRPGLTLIGEPTQGILSDALERHLPNGWFMTLSNEVYRASDGELYEDRGLPPHIEIPFLDRTSREAGRDAMLDHVLGI